MQNKEIMIISIGSKNPVKIDAVRDAASKIWEDADVVSFDCESGVSEQPTSEDEAIEGATNRAKKALELGKADIGVGIEGYTDDTKHGMFVTAWIVAVDKKSTIGIGGSGRLLLPDKIVYEIRLGNELGPVMDRFLNQKDVKHKLGASGVFTSGLIPRKDALQTGVIYALTKIINPQYYHNSIGASD